LAHDKIKIQSKYICFLENADIGGDHMRNKKGFTLIEIVIVIAIIVILTAAVSISVALYLGKAKTAAGDIESHQSMNDAASASADGSSPSEITVTPAVTFMVTFADWDGTVLKTTSVNSGSAATPPSDPTRTGGYKFSKWDVPFSNVTGAMTVTAVYATTPITNVSISGTATRNYDLVANPTPSLAGTSATYQWQISSSSSGGWSNITGATSKTYTIGNDGFEKKYIRVIITGTGGYSGTTTSSATGKIN